jgi:hypothetical protein
MKAEAPAGDEGANPMPNQAKRLTGPNGCGLLAHRKRYLSAMPGDFPLFTEFFLHCPTLDTSRIAAPEGPGKKGMNDLTGGRGSINMSLVDSPSDLRAFFVRRGGMQSLPENRKGKGF